MTHPHQKSLTANHYIAEMSNDLHHSQNSWIKTVKIDNLGFERGVREIQRIIMTSISTQNSTPLCKKTVYTRGSLYAEKTVVNAICTLTPFYFHDAQSCLHIHNGCNVETTLYASQTPTNLCYFSNYYLEPVVAALLCLCL